jgi:curved DNA-binding protein
MAVKYKDYYQTLGVKRKASRDEIRKAYRELAKKYHPDVNPGDKVAEERFKDVQEAYAVLSDSEKRRTYDQLGTDWRAGSDFTPPPGWGGRRVEFRDWGDLSDVFGGGGGFSDFFQSIFGGFGMDEAGSTQSRRRSAARGNDMEASIQLDLEDVHSGVQRVLTLHSVQTCPDCGGRGIKRRKQCPTCGGSGQLRKPKRMTVKIAPGARQDSVLRLKGKGGKRTASGPAGDLYLRINIKPHRLFTVAGKDDLQMEVAVSPWEAALGAEIRVPTLEGSVTMSVPPGTQNGSRLRLRGQGLRRRDGTRGDQYAKLKIVVPTSLSSKEKQLLQELVRTSSFKPRG